MDSSLINVLPESIKKKMLILSEIKNNQYLDDLH